MKQNKKEVSSLRKLYRNSECDKCESFLVEVRLFGDKILCKKCYQKYYKGKQ